MASAQDVQDLLRLLTTGRNKLPMLAAMGRVKALQAANLRSISEIASSSLPTLKTALSSDEKFAKSLLAACKAHVKTSSSSSTSTKRTADTENPTSPTSKRVKSAYSLPAPPLTASELEASLALPIPSADEEAIASTTLYTNRAPLVLAFAVKLLEYTMPEQPLSSRLSLAQAVVSKNSRSKAVSLGIEKEGGENGWGTGMGQPRVRVLGREVEVLKRGGYSWTERERNMDSGENGQDGSIETEETVHEDADIHQDSSPSTLAPSSISASQLAPQTPSPSWSSSSPVTLKKSTFVAYCLPLTQPTPASAQLALSSLLKTHPNLTTATHNISAYRLLPPSSMHIHESSTDDGETGGGAHLLSILRKNNVTNVLLVVSRWYGGIMLGPDRWRIMERVAGEALAGLGRVRGDVIVRGGGGERREALWGLDIHGEGRGDGSVGGMPIHKPEGARSYLLKSFGRVEKDVEEAEAGAEGKAGKKAGKKKKTAREMEIEREENLRLLLGALGMLFESWIGHVSPEELDRRAWGWYVAVRPDVESGVAGWGGKGEVRLKDILELRRKG